MKIDTKCNLYEIYHENTKLNDISFEKIGEKILDFYNDPLLSKVVQDAYKVYPNKKNIKLKITDLTENFSDLVLKRRTIRDFKKYDISLEEISNILYYSYGCNGEVKYNKEDTENIQKLRTVPSAGALYPLDIYFAVLTSKELPLGLYHYNVANNSIEILKKGNYRKEVIKILPRQFSLETASCVMMLSATFIKNTIKYGNRGYRFVLLDAGHLMQNIYLTVTALGLGCYACGGFMDDDFNDLFDLDGINETALYCAPIGKGD